MKKQNEQIILSVILLIGAYSSLGLHLLLSKMDRERITAEFNHMADSRLIALENGLKDSLEPLLATVSLYNSSEFVSLEEFMLFTTPYVENELHYLRAIEWAPRVPHGNRDTYEKVFPGGGFPIVERSEEGKMIPAKTREEYFPVLYINPLSGNENARGFDLASEDNRLDATRRAVKSGKVSITKPINLVQDSRLEPAYLAVAPYLKNNIHSKKSLNHAHQVEGVVVGVFNIKPIIEGSLVRHGLKGMTGSAKVRYCILDCTPKEKAQVVVGIPENFLKENKKLLLERRRAVNFGGREWELMAFPEPEFFKSQPRPAYAVLPIGMAAFTVILALYLRLVMRTGQRHELEKIQAETESKNKTIFFAQMSHEVRTPLAAVIGMIDKLLRTDLSMNQRQYAEVAQFSIQDTLKVLEDILDLSKMDVDKLTLEKMDFDLNAVLRNLEYIFRENAVKKELSFSIYTDPKIPKILIGDAVRVRQVLTNLLSNALKFTAKGKIRLSSELCREDAEIVEVQFTVSDTGMGIAPDQIEKVFKTFSQQDSAISRVYGGSGLGLSICKNLVAKMGGKISVSSLEGQGSVFTCSIPFKKSSRVPEKDLSEGTMIEKNMRVDARILVAEDNVTLRLVFESLLKDMGCFCRLAENGSEALEILQAESFDVMFLDLNMPVLDGFSAIRILREREGSDRHLPVCGISASTDPNLKEKCLREGMDFYLSKPFGMMDVRNVIISLMQNQVPADSETHVEDLLSEAVDWERFNAVVCGNQEVKKSLIETWAKESRSFFQAIPALIDKNDWAQAYVEAHGMRGAAAIFGAPGISTLAEQLEKKIHEKDLDATRALLVRLSSENSRVVEILVASLDQPESTG